jgi:predicted O-methyltransferase YrrM
MAMQRLGIDGALAAYIDALVAPEGDLAALYDEMADHPDAMMMTHPDLGRLLALLVRAAGGRTVLEVGTFVGTSAAWMALGLAPDGRIDTLEADPAHADRAEAWFARVGLADRVALHRGPAADTLPGLADGAYDLAYIDADKVGYPVYLAHALRLVRRGGLIVADNAFRGGRLGRPPAEDGEREAAVRAYTARAMSEPRLLTAVLTVADGVTISVVR